MGKALSKEVAGDVPGPPGAAMWAVPLQTSCIMTVLQKRAAQQKKKSRCWVQIREADTWWLLQPIKAQLRR